MQAKLLQEITNEMVKADPREEKNKYTIQRVCCPQYCIPYTSIILTYNLSDNCPSVEIQLINIFLLLYADDTVLIAETPEGLQTMLNSLYS